MHQYASNLQAKILSFCEKKAFFFGLNLKKRKKERFNTYKKKSGGLIKKFKTLLE